MIRTLQASPLPFNAIPFDQLKATDFPEAIDQAITSALTQLQAIKDNTEPATFANTIEALEFLGQDLDKVSGIFFNLLHACTEPVLDEKAGEISQKLASFGNDIQLDLELFEKIKEVYDGRNSANLNDEQTRLLESSYKDFVRNGALLDESKKSKLREVDGELASLAPEFGQNLLKATNKFFLEVKDAKKIEHLPESSQMVAKEEAKKRKLDGWVFTLQAPSYIPFMKYMPDRELRKQLWLAYNQKAFNDEFSNSELCKKIAQLRSQRAQLLGYKTHAHFTLEKRMAKNPEQVFSFLEELEKPSVMAAKKEVADLEGYIKSELQEDIEIYPWDFSFYSEKYKKFLFDFEEEELRPYFPLEAVKKGIFLHGEKLYGLNFKATDLPTYHPDVECYEVTGEKGHIGLLYLDFFPRDNKRAGAWMTNYQGQGFDGSEVKRPHVSLVCNFTKPAKGHPSLLTFNEVQTLFHEFGHGLHSLLSDCHYPSQSGTNVHWDFVELPSQIMENWTYESESLDLFAHHYETGATIPKDLVKKLQASAQFQAGYGSSRQLSFSYVDMAWHTATSDSELDAEKVEGDAMKKFRILPKVPDTNFSVGFSHIFAGGYAAGYYSYKWAEVLDADAFELFKEKGIFDPSTAKKFYQEVLSKGDTRDPMELFKSFRGREPDTKALLRRGGLI